MLVTPSAVSLPSESPPFCRITIPLKVEPEPVNVSVPAPVLMMLGFVKVTPGGETNLFGSV